NQRQHPDEPAVGQGVVHEIHRPDLVRLGRDPTGPERHGAAPAAGPLPPQLQLFGAVQSVDPLGIHGPALPAQHRVEPAVAVAHPDRGELRRRRRSASWGGRVLWYVSSERHTPVARHARRVETRKTSRTHVTQLRRCAGATILFARTPAGFAASRAGPPLPAWCRRARIGRAAASSRRPRPNRPPAPAATAAHSAGTPRRRAAGPPATAERRAGSRSSRS